MQNHSESMVIIPKKLKKTMVQKADALWANKKATAITPNSPPPMIGAKNARSETNEESQGK